MVPAYVLTISFLVVWVLGVVRPNGLHIHRLIGGVSVGLGVLALLLATALPIVFPIFHFPPPSGTYPVEELVSHGYVVAAIDQPYAAAEVSFPDGHQIRGWTKDEIKPLYDQSLSPGAKVPTLNGQALPNGILLHFAQEPGEPVPRGALRNGLGFSSPGPCRRR